MARFGVLVMLGLVLSVAAHAVNLQMVMINGHAMVALNTFADYFGASVGYDGGRSSAYISLNGQSCYFVPYSTEGYIGNQLVQLETPVVIVDGTTYLPISFLCSGFSLGCTWNPSYQSVVVYQPATQTQFFFVLDFAWGYRSHYFERGYSPRDYANFRVQHQPEFRPPYRTKGPSGGFTPGGTRGGFTPGGTRGGFTPGGTRGGFTPGRGGGVTRGAGGGGFRGGGGARGGGARTR